MLRKLKGFDLKGVLELTMPQFYYLLDSLGKEFSKRPKNNK